MSILLPELGRPDLVIVIQDDQTRGTCETLLQKLRPLDPDRIYVDSGGYGRIMNAYFTDAFGPNVVRELPKQTSRTDGPQPPPWYSDELQPARLRYWPAQELEGLIERCINALMGPKAPRVMNDDGLSARTLESLARGPFADFDLSKCIDPNLPPDSISIDGKVQRAPWLPKEKTMQGIGGGVEATGGFEHMTRQTRQRRAAEVNRVIDETIRAQQTQPASVVDILSASQLSRQNEAIYQADKEGRDLAARLLIDHSAKVVADNHSRKETTYEAAVRLTSDDLGDHFPPDIDARANAPQSAKPEPTFMEKVQREREELQKARLALKLTQEERHSFEAMKREVEWMRSRRPYRPGFVESSDDYGCRTPVRYEAPIECCGCQSCTAKRERMVTLQQQASHPERNLAGFSSEQARQGFEAQRHVLEQLGTHPSVYQQPGQNSPQTTPPGDPSIYKQPGQR